MLNLNKFIIPNAPVEQNFDSISQESLNISVKSIEALNTKGKTSSKAKPSKYPVVKKAEK